MAEKPVEQQSDGEVVVVVWMVWMLLVVLGLLLPVHEAPKEKGSGVL